MISLLWTLRAGLLVSLFCLIGVYGFYLKNRDKYPQIVESKRWNVFQVLWYNCVCYLTAGILPQDSNVIPVPSIISSVQIQIGFRIIGFGCLCAGIFLVISTIKSRKVVGIQNTKAGLITTGTYHFIRHAIYTGIILNAVGIALLSLNIDGIFCLPAIVLGNYLEAKFEEWFDLEPRFGSEYQNYRKSVAIFGPWWFWTAVIGSTLLLILIS